MGSVRNLRPRLRRRWIALISSVLAVVTAVVVFASPYLINSVSMASTIQPGEVVLVDRASTALGLQRGEVILFYPPINSSGIPFIKRVIGLPGDQIEIVNDLVYLNGTQLDEPYVAANTPTLTSVWDYKTTVPAGSVFVMGDDRMESWDSRTYGAVPFANVIGRAWLVVSPSFSLATI